VGVSGSVTPHPHLEPRSSADFPYPPTIEHPVSAWIDKTCKELGYHPLRVPRAILPVKAGARDACAYSGYCGSFGCSTNAKGSARAALIEPALATGRCDLRPHAKVFQLQSDAKGRVTRADYYAADGQTRSVSAHLFVVACQAIETSRLLLSSPGPAHPDGLGNRHGQLGRNLVFSAGGDMTYIQLALGTILARFLIGYFFIPAYYEREIYSPYEYMGRQLGPRVKNITTGLFMIGGILAQGARVYIAAKALQVVTGTDVTTSIVIIGVVSIGWTIMGGITTVVWTDAIQFLLFVVGAVAAVAFGDQAAVKAQLAHPEHEIFAKIMFAVIFGGAGRDFFFAKITREFLHLGQFFWQLEVHRLSLARFSMPRSGRARLALQPALPISF